MTIFKTIARSCRAIGAKFDELHKKWWIYKNRNKEVTVELVDGDSYDSIRVRDVHDPERLRRFPDLNYVYEDTTLQEALEEYDTEICDECFRHMKDNR